MDISKARKFNQKMSRPKYSKGGYIKKLGNREYFATGGIPQNVTPAGVGGAGNPTNTNGVGIGGISNALGLNAQSANIQGGTNAAQLNNAYTGANNAINAQVGLTNTLTPQATNAVNNQNTVAQEELGMTQGTGPNPALNQLATTTGTNVANEAALLAGQRGSSANPGMAARSIATNAGQNLENAAGQAATLESEQQIAAQNNLANLSNNQIGQTQGATQALNTAQQNEQGILQNANSGTNNAAVGMQSNINNNNASTNKGLLGGITSGLSSLTGGLLNKGGEVHPKLAFVHKMTKMGLDHFDDGGKIAEPSPSPAPKKETSPFENFATTPVSPADLAQGVRDIHFADGGSVNPLVNAIVARPMMPSSNYNPIGQLPGPVVDSGSPSSDLDLGKSMKTGYQAGKDWSANRDTAAANAGLGAGQNTFTNDYLAGPAETVATGGLGSNQYAKGGSIWDLHPSEHDKYSANHFSQYFSEGGKSKEVKAMVSAHERYLNPEEVEMVKHGADPKKLGYKFPGKDKVPGKNSLKNDTIPATLEEGGIVIPLSVEKTNNSDKMRLFTLKSLRATGKHMKKPMGMK